MTTFQPKKLTRMTRWREMLVSIIATLLIVASATLAQYATAEAAPGSDTAAPVTAQKDRPFRATAISSDLPDDLLGKVSIGGSQTQRRTNTGASDSNWIIPAIVLIVAWSAVGVEMVRTERRQDGTTDPNQ